MILIFISAALFIAYCVLMLYYKAGWSDCKLFTTSDTEPTIRISVIIPARNEEKNIGQLLASLEIQTYPGNLFEVIVVDDHSEDNTTTIVKNYPFAKLVKLKSDQINSYKKKAIETGIAAASGDLIITTDADCVVKENWLRTIAGFKESTQAIFIAAPVSINYNQSILQTFQSMDFLVLQGITAASVQKKFHNMCNGANLAYERKAFIEVNGFNGIDHIASGDDMLLMQKIAVQFPDKIFYLMSEEAIVTTKPVSSWKEFFRQRIRWASKATNYNEFKIFSVLFLVYFFNCTILVLFIAGFWTHYLWLAFGIILILKTMIEYVFIKPVANFFNRKNLLKFFPFFQPLHIIYTIIAGWLGTFGSFEWKGRRVK